ncbi:ankyrin repeat-containing domain protein [Scenedesmus sp. NREL 46B-D3]|nr:ankyrin repeat-containing domain protein [Scenedesmus sp. NREL 46B-D3]
MHKPKLVRQLLALGALPMVADSHSNLEPLHLACMGQVKDQVQVFRLVAASESLYDLQTTAKSRRPPRAAAPGPGAAKQTGQQRRQRSGSASKSSCRRCRRCWRAAHILDPLVSRYRGGVDVDAETFVNRETPLTFAAYTGAYEVAEQLLKAGADPNLPRSKDAARPLDLAVDSEHARLACLLLEHGAEVLPGPRYFTALSEAEEEPAAALHPKMLLLNAVQIDDPPDNARLVEMLLQRSVPLEEVWERSGETALGMAVSYDDVEMVRLLVAAGAKLETVRLKHPMHTPLVDAAIRGKPEIVQILLDAGANFASYVDNDTGYDLVQSAANAGQFEAVVKLVEAGASWRLARGQQRVVNGSIFYVPEILSIQKPGLKLSFIEGRLKLAEKAAKQRKDRALQQQSLQVAVRSLPTTTVSTQRQAAAAASSSSRPSRHRCVSSRDRGTRRQQRTASSSGSQQQESQEEGQGQGEAEEAARQAAAEAAAHNAAQQRGL